MLKGRREWLILGVLALFLFFAKTPLSFAVSSDDSFTVFDALFKKYGKRFSVPWRWLKATAMTESSLGQAKSVRAGILEPKNIEKSVSSDGKSWGLMQTTLPTAREIAGVIVTASWLNVPENSVRVGAEYFARMISRFGLSDRESIVRAYNGGPGFKSTVQGRTLTPIYYAKWVSNLAVIMQKQPGDELERG